MTRPEPITVPSLERFARMQERYFRHGMASAVGSCRRPVLEGQAIEYRRVFEMDGELCMFAPGAFSRSLRTGKPIAFCVDHNTNVIYASTRDALQVFEDSMGVTFRLDLRRVANGPILARMADCEDRCSVSIGYRPVASVVERMGDYNVRVITDADLIEISQVRAGRVRSAFAFVTDADLFHEPAAGYRSDDFVLAAAARSAAQSYDRMISAVSTLAARFDAVCATLDVRERPSAPPP